MSHLFFILSVKKTNVNHIFYYSSFLYKNLFQQKNKLIFITMPIYPSHIEFGQVFMITSL